MKLKKHLPSPNDDDDCESIVAGEYTAVDVGIIRKIARFCAEPLIITSRQLAQATRRTEVFSSSSSKPSPTCMRSSKRLMRALLPDCHFGSSARVNTLNTPPPSLSIRMKVSTSIPGPTPSIVFRTTKRYSGARRIRAVLIVIVFEQERK